MRSEYVYPRLADRTSVEEWVEAGRPEMSERAAARASELFDAAKGGKFSSRTDRAIRARFDIHLEGAGRLESSGT